MGRSVRSIREAGGGGKAKAQELTEKDMGDRAASGKMEEWIRQVFLYFSIRKPSISVIIIAI